jgi:iron complex outermembrane receptor protein
MKSSVPYAVAAILAGAAFRALAATPATDPAPPANDGTNAGASADASQLSTVIVTAQRRTENIQDVPISMQALTSQTMRQLNIQTFDDYVKYLPNVTAASNGPGQNEIFMRGVSAGSQASQGSGSTGLWPNVAVYLDDQSVQLPNRNLDVYAADLQRIEVLEGPQGTLFGAGAQAGVIRYITNKPQLDATSGSIEAGYGTTAHGDNNSDLTAVLNLPIIAGHMAVRGVIYDARRGGYIDNVPATFARQNTDVGIHYAGYPAVNGQCPDGQPNNGYCVPPGSPTVNNFQLARKAINPAEYQGTRVEALYKFNDDWDLLISQSYQNLDSQGVFYQQPYASDGTPLSPLEVTLFNNAFDKDKFENTAWTVHGKLSSLDFVYTGGYLDRNVEQVGDYTNYARGVYADYYQCFGPLSAANPLTPTCFSPSSTWRSVERNVHQQHELRLSTPDNWRLRAIAGLYYEDNTLYDQTGWHYKSIPNCTSNGAPGTPGNTGCLSDVGTFPGTTVQNPGLQNDTTSFYQDQLRQTRQIAEYFSASYDVLPHVTLTGGIRHFRFLNSEAGSVLSSFGCFQAGTPPGGCQSASSTNLNAKGLSDTEDGNKVRANLTWHVRPDLMVYYTFSQGFRPGGFNQNGGSLHGLNAAGVAQYVVPRSYTSDNLTNNEFGWKTQFFDHRLQWNGAVYYDNWTNVQIEFFNPGVVGNIFYDTNGQDFLIKGIETSFVARLMTGLTVQGAADWNKSSQTNSPALIDNNPADTGNVGKPITQVCSAGACSAVTNPFGPIGAPSANSPPLQFSLLARYDWLAGDYVPYVQVAVRHTAHSFSQAGANPEIGAGGSITTSRGRFENPAYSTVDAAIGVSKGDWHVDLHGDNLTNSNASTFTSTDQFIIEQTPLRPRVIELSAGYRF